MQVNNSGLGEGDSSSPHAGVMGVQHNPTHSSAQLSSETHTHTVVEEPAAEREGHLKRNAAVSHHSARGVSCARERKQARKKI